MAAKNKRIEQETSEFIDLYRQQSCLWKVKSKEYKDKTKKDAAYEILVKKLKENNPDATRDDVTRKINSLRSCFRKEFNKVTASIKSGNGTDEIYTPHLWYYELLLFLKDHEIPRHGISNADFDSADDDAADAGCSEDENPEGSTNSAQNLDVPPTPPSIASESSTYTPRKRKRPTENLDKSTEILSLVGEKLRCSTKDDEYDIIGKNVAEKLRKVDTRMRMFAEKLINEALFEAQMGTLHRYAYIHIPPQNNEQNIVRQALLHGHQTAVVQGTSTYNVPTYVPDPRDPSAPNVATYAPDPRDPSTNNVPTYVTDPRPFHHAALNQSEAQYINSPQRFSASQSNALRDYYSKFPTD